MLLNVHRNHKAYEGRGEVGKWVVWRWGKREVIYISLHCHHQNDSSIKMGSDESHFNVPLIVRDKVRRQCSQTTTFEEKGQSKRNGTEVLQPPAYRLTARPGRLTIRPVCLYLRLCVLCLSIRLPSILPLSQYSPVVHLSGSSISIFAYSPSFLCLRIRLSSILPLSQYMPIVHPSSVSVFAYRPSFLCLSIRISSVRPLSQYSPTVHPSSVSVFAYRPVFLCLTIRLSSSLPLSQYLPTIHPSSVSVCAYRPSFRCLSIRLPSILPLSQHFPVLWPLYSPTTLYLIRQGSIFLSSVSPFTYPSIYQPSRLHLSK